MSNCQSDNKSDCFLFRVRKAIKEKMVSKDIQANPRQACKGTEKLNKIAFLSMIGAERYVPPKNSIISAEEIRLETLNNALKENNYDEQAAAYYLGMRLAVFKRRRNILSSIVNSTNINEEPASPTPERRFFEKLNAEWNITSFNSITREVCVEVNNGKTVSHLSSFVPKQNNPS